ncbi:hypothetical protein D9M69_609820 [compost metagenome]
MCIVIVSVRSQLCKNLSAWNANLNQTITNKLKEFSKHLHCNPARRVAGNFYCGLELEVIVIASQGIARGVLAHHNHPLVSLRRSGLNLTDYCLFI